jgi:DNA-binding SARP family transcriptional activator
MLELRTLGAIDLRDHDNGRVESVLRHAKRLSLLVYLSASARPRMHRRDTLVALLWPDLDTAHARGALRQELSQLRRALGPSVLWGRASESVGVDDGQLWCDAAAFDRAVTAGNAEDALSLMQGEFLPGLHVGALDFERWLDAMRSRFRHRSAEAARSLTLRADARGDVDSAIRWARLLTELSPSDESGWQLRMRLLDRFGDRAGALGAYDDMVRHLRAELEVAPSPESQALARRIRRRQRPLTEVVERPGR